MYRRDRSLRITPDVLADHLLHNACLTKQGRQTGYIRKIFDTFGGLCQAQLLRNIAELDWRVNQTSEGKQVDLLSEVWGDIKTEFENADATGRLKILDVLIDLSFFQPNRILEIATFAMENPTDEVQDDSQTFRTRHLHVLEKLPALLRRVCYTPECLPPACDLLWELGRDDHRSLNRNHDHAIRVLSELAGYTPYKNVLFNEALIGCVERWIESSDAARYVQQLCELLDPLLEKTGHITQWDETALVMMPFHVSEQNTRKVRDRAISILEMLLSSDDPKSVLIALKSFRKALNNPMPVFNLKVGHEECQSWASEELRILEILERFMSQRRFAIATLRALGVPGGLPVTTSTPMSRSMPLDFVIPSSQTSTCN